MVNFAPDLTLLSIEELATVHEQFQTISQVAAGLESQPRSLSSERKFTLNKAGELMNDLLEMVNGVLGDVVREARTRVPSSRSERGRWFFLAITDEVWTNANPEFVAEVAQKLISEMPSCQELETRP